MSMSVALMTDKYELTMLDAALAHGSAHRTCVFEVFTRRLPSWRRYGVVAGTGRFLEALNQFHFTNAHIDMLHADGALSDTTLDYLANYRFTGTISGYAEGEIYFPHSPVLTVEGTFAEAVLLETLVLSILNYDSAVASAASRMTAAAHGRPCLEMGSRRAHEEAAVAAARAAIIAGFSGTSNLEAGYRYGVPTIGTSAHAFTLLHDTEEEAFAAQVAALGTGTTLLVDTYDVTQGVTTAIKVAGTSLGAVRLDSGDLGAQAHTVREQLDRLGAHDTTIIVTSDLDEYAIASLQAAPVDGYGVGTKVVTGSGSATSSMVYKLVARENSAGIMEPVAKASTSKSSIGGRKTGARLLIDNEAREEVVLVGERDATTAWLSTHPDYRPLEHTFVDGGTVDPQWTGREGLDRAVARHAASRAELNPHALRLQSGDLAVDTTMLPVGNL